MLRIALALACLFGARPERPDAPAAGTAVTADRAPALAPALDLAPLQGPAPRKPDTLTETKPPSHWEW